MSTSKKVRAGLRSFSVTTRAGQAYAFDVSDGTATVTPGRRKRETIASATRGFAGVKETPMPGKIVAEVIDDGSLSIQAVDDWDDVTATFVLSNGKTYTIEGCSTDAPELDAAGGKFTLTLEGDVTEVTFG